MDIYSAIFSFFGVVIFIIAIIGFSKMSDEEFFFYWFFFLNDEDKDE